MSTILKQLNHYSTYTQPEINNIINFINNGVIPVGLNPRQQQTYNRKFGQDFVVNNGVLFYHPNPNLLLEVVPPALRQNRLQLVYNNPQQGLGLGINTFYSQVASHYLGITKTLASEFLKKQGDYMILHPYQNYVNKPILAKTPNERWGIDLIVLDFYRLPNDPNPPRHNSGYRYLLMCVDYFSKKVFARPLRTRTAVRLRNAINDICVQNNTYPHILQGDSEFSNATFQAWANLHNITLIRTTSNRPQGNGQIERMNLEMWRRLRAGFVRNNNIEWANHLDDYVINMNSQRHSKTKYTPNQLWIQGYNPPPNNNVIHHIEPPDDHMNADEVRQRVQERLVNSAQRQIENIPNAPIVFNIGDNVRIAMKVLEPDIRKKIKEGRHKTVSVKYTPEIYIVQNVFPPAQGFNLTRQGYSIRNQAGEVIMRGAVPRKFYPNEILRVPNGHTASTVPNRARGNQINMSTPY